MQRDKNGRFTEQLMRNFPLFTNGEFPEIDRLGIVVQCLDEMDCAERRATVGYINARFAKALELEG